MGRILPTPANVSHDGRPIRSSPLYSGTSTAPGDTALSSATPEDNRSLTNVTPTAAQSDVQLGLLYRDSIRKCMAPDRHMAVPREVGRRLLMETDKYRLGVGASRGNISALLKLKSENAT